jgi:hypothetical protein
MRKSLKLVALAVLFSFPGGVVTASAAPSSDATAPAVVAPAPATKAPSIRASIEAVGRSSIVLMRTQPDTAPPQSGGGRHLSGAAKAAIWIAAISVTSAWAYKTFSVTRGTD